MKITSLTIILLHLVFNLSARQLSDFLLPVPKSIVETSDTLSIQQGIICTQNITVNKPLLFFLSALSETNIDYQLSPISLAGFNSLLKVDLDHALGEQAYELRISQTGISIKGGSDEGIYYALQTLKQISSFAKVEGYWPCVNIKDAPDFERRGIMLDISRDKVPTMATLFSLIDEFSEWKINELQLYTEHTFAYKNHETVWKDASPLTAEEVQILDKYCAERFIDLVPNQNSFGHMKRWLIHDEYEHLAELSKPGKTIWGMSSHRSLSPAEPGSFELMQELYAELLPNFSSQYFNIGCDETVELGVGKSKQMCIEQGKGKVYLNYLLKLKEEVDKYGRTTQFWGDIILNHPELIEQLPKDMVALIWGYNADHPFDKQCSKFQKAGLDYYVCPGTSTWNSIIGRNKTSFANLKNAAENGLKYKAKGFLNTNWGDQGHWQPLSVSYPAFIYGAGLSWNVTANKNMNIAGKVSCIVFNDYEGQSGKALINLGNAYLQTGVTTDNSNIFHQILKRNRHSIKTDRWTKFLSLSKLNTTIAYLENQSAEFNNAGINRSDSAIIKQEVKQAVELALHACHLAKAKLQTTDGYFKSINEEQKSELIAELTSLIQSYQTIWIERNRIGGLADSTNKLEAVLKSYN